MMCREDDLMCAEGLGRFYEAALTAGAITSGFIGTFLAFRIQREAGYYRQVGAGFHDGAGEGHQH